MTATLSLATVLAEAARRYPEKVAVIDGDQRISYAQLWREAKAMAAGLVAQGVQPGDAVALICPNVADFPRAYYAILAAGGVVVPVHLLLTPAEVAYVIQDSGAKLVVCHPAVTALASQAGVTVVTPSALD